MAPRTLRTLRLLTAWIRDAAPVDRGEIVVEGGAERLPTTVVRPRGTPDRLPTWILLHGVSRRGRSHSSLLRFAGALAAAGSRVLIPEIREWKQLRLAPERTLPVVRACVDHLACDGERTQPGVAGFSFGAPHVIRATTAPSLRGRIAGVLGFGGYYDLDRTVRFQFTGEHEWEGPRKQLSPNPYARWIVAANYLTAVPGHEGAGPVAEALRRLAAAASERQIPGDDPWFDSMKKELRRALDPGLRPTFDRLARPEGRESEPAAERELAAEVVEAARRTTPDLDVRGALRGVDVPVELVHGRADRLIPYTETLRLHEALATGGASVNATITGLFAHSRGNPIRAGVDAVHEAWKFVGALWRVLDLA